MAGETILVVDDNVQNLKLARVLFTTEGYDVKTAVDAEDALAQLERFTPGLILMDLQLPGMDGLALTRLLKSQGKAADTIIVALTAYAMKGDEERALSAGCDAYVSKPIDTTALPRLVSDLLARRASRTTE